MADATPILLFGAFDRHNFGDLLFPHIAAALLPNRPLIHAGLAARDLRFYGGHQARAITELAGELRDQPVHVLHVGGEILSCDAWQAAVMLQAPEKAQAILARYDRRPADRRDWAQRCLGVSDRAPYCMTRALFPQAEKVIYCAVGGVELPERDAALQEEVATKLRQADRVSVREKASRAHLTAAGVTAALLPDPAVMVAELCGNKIAQHTHRGEVARLHATFPQGYLAVQLSTDFGDDQTLSVIAAQLDAIAHDTGLAIVLFRAGAAPWHDGLACYRRLAARMHAPAIWLFASLHLWDICALVAKSCGYCGSSLHGRIVAMAYGLPRLNVRHPARENHTTKQEAYCAAWEIPGLPTVAQITDIANECIQAVRMDATSLRNHGEKLARDYRTTFAVVVAL